jgi:hypothetical protein
MKKKGKDKIEHTTKYEGKTGNLPFYGNFVRKDRNTGGNPLSNLQRFCREYKNTNFTVELPWHMATLRDQIWEAQ